MKKELQSVTDHKVMSYMECAKELGWAIKENEETIEFTCNCGNSDISYSGFIGTEQIECESCGKIMIDLFSPLPNGNATCTVLNYNDYTIEKDDAGSDRYWIAINGKGNI